ncbi:MAG: hypothetical protein LC733_08465 [Actinobacteria bacterium]|nr:hypothetical protein [Actinomycetota bacterium]
MAPHETTTLRVPVELRDEIARIANQRGTTLLDVVSDAIHRLSREEWWDNVHDAIEKLTDDEHAAYEAEVEVLDDAAGDGIRGD